MNHSELLAARIASEAIELSGLNRASFLNDRCGGDPKLIDLVSKIMDELIATDASTSVSLADVNPLATIDSFRGSSSNKGSSESSNPDPREADETDDPFATFFSHRSDIGNSTFDRGSSKSLSNGDNTTRRDSTMGPANTMDAVSGAPVERTADAAFEVGGDVTLSPDAVFQVEDCCQRFMKAWEDGTEPRIVDFLPRSGDMQQRDYIAFQLVVIDIQQREKRYRPISEQVYLSQLPECRNVIQSALTKRTNAAPQSHGSAKPTVVHGKSEANQSANNGDRNQTGRTSDIRYQPVKMHAKGGLGAVYRAKDMELSRTVALKRILPAHEDNLNSRARFVFEAEVTGSLEHPGIVPVYGLGTYGEGQPYYAMRFIRGESFSDAIAKFHHKPKRSNLKPDSADAAKNVATNANVNQKGDLDFYGREFRQLVRRLVDTCNAMHYAHERGVLHRDLKPDNVMLGQYGETLVVDWGLAKLMSSSSKQPSYDDVSLAPLTVTDSGLRTTIGQAIGTPMYMSSEQALGLHDELTPASDVYSLGAMLFNVISGQHPIEGKTTRDIIINVRNGKTKNLLDVLPSAPKPLASICRKAMMKEPQDRYQTAIEFAEDIDRWLSDEQVLAHADTESMTEKAGRLIRRYRGWTVSGAAALFAITMVSIIASLLINQAKRAEEVAKVRATHFKGEAVQRYHESREAIDTWLVQSNDALQFFPGTQAVRQRLLTVAAEDYAKLANAVSEDPELELERRRTLIRLGDLSQLREDRDGAKKYYQDAIDLLASTTAVRSLITKSNDTKLSDIDCLYAAEAGNAKSRMAIAFSSEGKLVEADKLYLEAGELLATVHQKFDDPLVLRYRASTEINHGELLAAQNRFDEAEKRYLNGLKLFKDLGESTTHNDQLSVSRAEELLGRMMGTLGKHTEAIARFAAAVNLLKPLVESNQDYPEYLDALASVFISQASIFRVQGQINSERVALNEAVTHYRALVKALPDLPRYSENLAATLIDSSLLLFEVDRCSEAKPLLLEAREVINSLSRRYGAPPYYQSQLATIDDVLGQVLWSLGEYGEAQQAYVRALQGFDLLNTSHPDIADYSERLAITKSHLSFTVEGEDADEGFRSSAETLAKLVAKFPGVPDYASWLGYIYYFHAMKRHTGDPTSATELFGKARDTWVAMGTLRDPKTSERLAWLLAMCPVEGVRDATSAKKYAQEALTAAPQNHHYRSTLALAMIRAGKVTEADAAEAEALFNATPVDEPDRDARYLLTMAVLAAKAGNVERAKEFRDQGVQWMSVNAPNAEDLLMLVDLSNE